MQFQPRAMTSLTLNPARFDLPLADMVQADRADRSTRACWLARCEARLQELRPGQEHHAIAALALDMWPDVHRFSPEIAAEMEHEASRLEQ